MTIWAANTYVEVDPFTRQIDEREVVIGRSDAAEFLVLPLEALEILDHLLQGKSVGQAQTLYQEKYGEVPDIDSLLDYLKNKGFVYQQEMETPAIATQSRLINQTTAKSSKRYHFENFPPTLARRIFSHHALLSYGSIIGLGLIAAILQPSIIPGWQAQFFSTNLTLMSLVFAIIQFGSIFLHEMAHLVAARAVGVSCRLGIGNRMWMLVAETDMTGVWSIPRQQRYLPYLAGPLLDAVCASILALIFFIAHYGWIGLHPLVAQMGRAMLLFYLTGMLWQCFFFVRTDFYYVFTNVFRCKNLLKDTEVLVKNFLARWFRWLQPVNQSHIPPAEMKVIRGYAWLWFIGRASAIALLLFIDLPLIWNYLLVLFKNLTAGYTANPYAFIDAILMAIFFLIPQAAGLWLWRRNSHPSKR